MWRRIGCIGLVVVVLAVAGAIIYKQATGGGGSAFRAGKQNKEEKGNFEAARIDDLKIVVEATGVTEPITDVDVKSEATGRITEFYVEEGNTVKVGDLICKLDQSNQLLAVQQREIAKERARLSYEEAKKATGKSRQSSLEAALASAQAGLDSAREAYDTALATVSRIEELHAKGYATDQELENARQSVASAKATLDSARASLENAELQLEAFEDTSRETAIELARLGYEAAKVSLAEARKLLGDSVIVSPIDGIILEKQLDVGDSVVSINSAFSGGNTIVKVADLSKMQVRTSVDEIDIGKIKVGQDAVVTVDAYFDREFPGTVTNVHPQGIVSGGGLVNFIAIVEVDNSENLLKGNMTASVKIEAAVLRDVLLIALAATRAGEKPDTTIVHVLKEGEDAADKRAKTEERDVKVGDTDYYDIVVLEGLEEGEMVKVRGFATTIQFD